MAEQKNTFLEKIEGSTIQDFIIEVRGHAGEMTIEIKAEQIVQVLMVLKQEFGFNYLVDITASDHYTDEKRFELSYNIVSHANGQRLRISAFVEEEEPKIASITGIWKSADWMEREAFDMVGIQFEGHEDLRRIYLPEDFQWYPLRKEFPLLGIPGSLSLPEKDPPKGYK
ncbi:MAG: NADH-quinone oxidoreductase subunit C [Bacteroidia bacterium]|nr:NADH-quinone oxidoreductase subunit C [Bacteroidia bacterium]